MLSSFFRPNSSRSRQRQKVHGGTNRFEPQQPQNTDLCGPARSYATYQHQTVGLTSDQEGEDEDDDIYSRDVSGQGESEGAENNESEQDNSPLLPLFDSQKLDSIAVFPLTHTIRQLVVTRCDTVLTWEQLRAPQISQFLVKPIEQEIKTGHFSAATVYALMANCLQFTKEILLHPGNSGTSKTRALLCELLAIKLLREYPTRGLIDAMSYDFDPLHGHAEHPPTRVNTRTSWQASTQLRPRSARISCLEIAVRAQAKRFLSHPLVIQQLEAIWNGSIVFYAAADHMHRPENIPLFQSIYGTSDPVNIREHTTEMKVRATYGRPRKVVTLYNPRNASLFKLSRLRVPRYRNILSTLSFAILLGLFLAVLTKRSPEITPLEIVFWFWAAGYMLDEVVCFNEQGFSLYIASLWNAVDLGILLLLVIHLCLRVYGIVTQDHHKHEIARTAYDVLAADAILLFPRLFSVLDHIRSFSQLIIAFRMMAADLVLILVLVFVSCSGFFVALSLSFGNKNVDDPSSVAYALLQMFLGFTPAVWDRWDAYTPIGRTIFILFLFISHFLVVTILVTVLTNSFMAVVQNANEEHQFLFAVNTISNVKSESLFSYVAPFNVVQWLLTPLRFIMPFQKYVKVNRLVIKITHFPVLWCIYFYERTILQFSVVNTIDTIENKHKKPRNISRRLPRLVREPSIATFKQDQALEEVFKQPFDATIQTIMRQHQRKSSTVVNRWMKKLDEEPPQDQRSSTTKRLKWRGKRGRNQSNRSRLRESSRRPDSIASDPAELTSHTGLFSPGINTAASLSTVQLQSDAYHHEEDADGDDELASHNNGEKDSKHRNTGTNVVPPLFQVDYFSRDSVPRAVPLDKLGSVSSSFRTGYLRENARSASLSQPASGSARSRDRNLSISTVVHAQPTGNAINEAHKHVTTKEAEARPSPPSTRPSSGDITPRSKPTSSGAGRRTPKTNGTALLRPALPSLEAPVFRSTPNLQATMGFNQKSPKSKERRRLEMDLVSDIGDNKAIGGGYVGAVPASFATQMVMTAGGFGHVQDERDEEQEMFGRLMMARMNSLEEGFRDVIHEMREGLRSNVESRNRSPERASRPSNQASHQRKVRGPRRKKPSRQGSDEARENTSGRADEDLMVGHLSSPANSYTDDDLEVAPMQLGGRHRRDIRVEIDSGDF